MLSNMSNMQSVYTAMGKVGSNTGAIGGIAPSQTFTWPPATPKTTELMVLLLARELRVQDALSIVKRIRERGMPCNKEVPFGLVVESPLAPGQPLTVCMFTLTGFLTLHISTHAEVFVCLLQNVASRACGNFHNYLCWVLW
jgi:hypothetical protein